MVYLSPYAYNIPTPLSPWGQSHSTDMYSGNPYPTARYADPRIVRLRAELAAAEEAERISTYVRRQEEARFTQAVDHYLLLERQELLGRIRAEQSQSFHRAQQFNTFEPLHSGPALQKATMYSSGHDVHDGLHPFYKHLASNTIKKAEPSLDLAPIIEHLLPLLTLASSSSESAAGAKNLIPLATKVADSFGVFDLLQTVGDGLHHPQSETPSEPDPINAISDILKAAIAGGVHTVPAGAPSTNHVTALENVLRSVEQTFASTTKSKEVNEAIPSNPERLDNFEGSPKAASSTMPEHVSAPFHALLEQFLGAANNDQRSSTTPSSNNPLAHILSQVLGSNGISGFNPSMPPTEGGTSGSNNRTFPAEEAEAKDIAEAIRLSLQTESSRPNPDPEAAQSSESPASPAKGKGKLLPKDPSTGTSEDISSSMCAIDDVLASFQTATEGFKFPAPLDFTSPRSGTDSAFNSSAQILDKLSLTSKNAPVRYLDGALSHLIEQLDAVESWGNDGIRERRKYVLGLVEEKIQELEREIEGRWRSWNSKQQKVLVKQEASTVSHNEVEVPEDLTSKEDIPISGRVDVELGDNEVKASHKDEQDSDWSDVDNVHTT